MKATDDFWDDLLSYIREQRLIPVVGPDLNVVETGTGKQTLTTLIGEQLVHKHGLTVPAGKTTMGEAVAAFLREHGAFEADRLYRDINNIIVKMNPAPGDALRNLAAIDDLHVFVATTPDRLLAQAVNEVRFDGRSWAREIVFSPNQSTPEQSRNAVPAASTETVVLNLFGRNAATPQYAIHEEDRLEWMHALLSDTASLPSWLDHQLKDCPLLYIGCEIPDWVGRFLLRMSASRRLADEKKQFFFAGCSPLHDPSLSSFFDTYCRKTQVQQISCTPTDFVAELRQRWEKDCGPQQVPTPVIHPPDKPGSASIFISYMREDGDAAARLNDGIKGLGGDPWLDRSHIFPGDDWHNEVLAAIRRNVQLFVPIISATTERVNEGYVFREWREAVERSHKILGRNFIVPVIVDDDYAGDASTYRKAQNRFGELHFGHAPAGRLDQTLEATLVSEIRAMRRASDAA